MSNPKRIDLELLKIEFFKLLNYLNLKINLKKNLRQFDKLIIKIK